MKRTVAILGENEEQKLEIALELAKDSYPVVLQVEIGHQRKIVRKISKGHVKLAVTTYTDSFLCAWEADVIIIVDSKTKLIALAGEIQNYVTGKIIIVLLKESALSAQVKYSLRYARNVFVYKVNPIAETTDTLKFVVVRNVSFSHETSSQTVGDAGCNSIAAETGHEANLVSEIKRLLEVSD